MPSTDNTGVQFAATHSPREPVQRLITPSAAASANPEATEPAELCYFERGSARNGEPTYLFCHATGFHARCWDKVIDRLPAESHVIAVDMRGHGRSAKVGPYNWANFANDTCALVDALNLQNIVGIGHSMGGNAIAQTGALLGGRFQRLLLVDPVILDPEKYHLASGFALGSPEEHPVARRKAQFDSWQAMYERFIERSPYLLWRPEILQDYCRYGVLPDESGEGMTLACPPLVEASVYLGSGRQDIRHMLPSIEVPVAVLRAAPAAEDSTETDFTTSPTWPALADNLPNGVDIYLPELTHFIAMQAPEMVAYAAQTPVQSRAQIEHFLTT